MTFSHYFFGPNRVYAPNDFDDFAVCAGFLDLLKFVGVSHSVFPDEKKISTDLMMRSYIRGITGKRWGGGRSRKSLSLKMLGSAAQNWISSILKRSKKKPKPENFFPRKT